MLAVSTILFPTDFSENAKRAFRVGLDVARATGAELCVMHALSVPEVRDDALLEKVRARQEIHTEGRLRDLVSSSNHKGVHVTTHLTTDESPEEAVIAETDARDADLIVLGAYGSGGKRRYDLGHVARDVFREAECPVLTVHDLDGTLGGGKVGKLFRRVLVPTDFSEASRAALNHARAVSNTFGSQVLHFHVVEEFVPPGVYGLDANPIRDMAQDIEDRARTEMRKIAADFESDGIPVENHIAGGHAPSQIVEFAEAHDVDLIVIASRGNRIERFVIGSVADRVVRASSCSVLTIKPDGKSIAG